MLPAQDMQRARAFYVQTLELITLEELPDGGINYNAGGTWVTVFPSRVAASGNHTQLGFDVQDISAVIKDLESKSVHFEDYEMPGFKTEGHLVNIAPYNCAWFKDSEGNSLAIWESDSAASGTGVMRFADCRTETNLPANDMNRARRFYEESLGFRAVEEFADGGVAYDSGTTQFLVSPTTVTASRDHTQIAFDVQNLKSVMASLEEVGVVFGDHGVPGVKTKAHVARAGRLTSAWFKDSEGNALSLVEGLRHVSKTPDTI